MNARKTSLRGILTLGVGRRWRENTTLLLTILCAVCFLSTTLFASGTLWGSLVERGNKQNGEAHDALYNISPSAAEAVEASGLYLRTTRAESLFVVQGDPTTIDDNFPVAILNPGIVAMQRIQPMEGRLPEKAGEIAVERGALSRLRYGKAALGDTLSFDVLLFDGVQNMDNDIRTVEYTLVGILPSRDEYLDNYGGDTRDFAFLPKAYVSPEEQPLPGSAALSLHALRKASRK